MADAGAGPGEPLGANVGERLAAKARHEAEAWRDKEASERQHERVERKKADERAAALRHAAPPERTSRWASLLRVGPWTPVRALTVAAVVAGTFLFWRRTRR